MKLGLQGLLVINLILNFSFLFDFCADGKMQQGSSNCCSSQVLIVEKGNIETNSKSQNEFMVEIASSQEPIILHCEPCNTTLLPLKKELTVKNHLKALKSDRRMYLVLTGLRITEQPGVPYHLYLDLPEATDPIQNRKHYIGSINFYNADKQESQQESSSKNKFLSYDVTSLLGRLNSLNLLTEPLTITISPAGAPCKESRPIIDKISIIEQ